MGGPKSSTQLFKSQFKDQLSLVENYLLNNDCILSDAGTVQQHLNTMEIPPFMLFSMDGGDQLIFTLYFGGLMNGNQTIYAHVYVIPRYMGKVFLLSRCIVTAGRLHLSEYTD